MRTIEKQVFTFDELSDEAKEKARDWYRSQWDESDFELVIDDAVAIGEILGITFDEHAVKLHGGGTRYDKNIWYQVSYSQGDYACFEGDYRYKAGSVKEIKSYAGQDKTLHSIAERLQQVQKENFYQLKAKVNGSDSWYNSVDVWREDRNLNEHQVSDEVDREITDCLRSFMRWIYDQLRKEDEYRTSDEAVDDTLINNEYEFYEDGEVI